MQLIFHKKLGKGFETQGKWTNFEGEIFIPAMVFQKEKSRIMLQKRFHIPYILE